MLSPQPLTTTPARADAPLLAVYDDVLPRPDRYRQWALAQAFETQVTGEEQWHGIALVTDPTLGDLVAARVPGVQTHLTFFRRSPLGQVEPNFIHSDEGMGQITAILYLNPEPADGDGTTFWRYMMTGDVMGSARALGKDPALWVAWRHVEARFNRLLVFDSWHFHSRSLKENYGAGDTARLVQVAFGTRGAGPATTIREATVADVPALVAMGRRFRAATIYATRLPENPAQMAATAASLIASPDGLVLVVEHHGTLIGMIGTLLFPHHLSGEMTAGEVFFWVDPDHRGYGVRLLRRAEAWARARGATRQQLIQPAGSAEVGSLYERLGYTALEVAYEKLLTVKGV